MKIQFPEQAFPQDLVMLMFNRHTPFLFLSLGPFITLLNTQPASAQVNKIEDVVFPNFSLLTF